MSYFSIVNYNPKTRRGRDCDRGSLAARVDGHMKSGQTYLPTRQSVNLSTRQLVNSST